MIINIHQIDLQENESSIPKEVSSLLRAKRNTIKMLILIMLILIITLNNKSNTQYLAA